MQAMWKEWEVLSETSLNTYPAVTCTCYEQQHNFCSEINNLCKFIRVIDQTN